DPAQSVPSNVDLHAQEQPLPDEDPVDEDRVSASSGSDLDQSSLSNDLNAAVQPQHDEPSVGENVELDSSTPEPGQSSPSVLAQTPEEQPLQTTTAEDDFGKRSNEIEQRVLDRMEGAAAGVAATQTSTRAATSMEEHRSGAALRAALLV